MTLEPEDHAVLSGSYWKKLGGDEVSEVNDARNGVWISISAPFQNRFGVGVHVEFSLLPNVRQTKTLNTINRALQKRSLNILDVSK